MSTAEVLGYIGLAVLVLVIAATACGLIDWSDGKGAKP